ncbi:IS30 family transposase, partial [Pasteurella atlantica]
LGIKPKSIYAYIKRHFHCKDEVYNYLRRKGKKYHKRNKPAGKTYKEKVKTITFDNGIEFFAHEKIANELKCDTYFADPHSPWQRGLNENTNGLIRQYFPKGMDLRPTTQDELNEVERELNHRPRKRRGFHSPSELF